MTMQIPTTKKVYEAETILKALKNAARKGHGDDIPPHRLLDLLAEELQKAPTVEVYRAQDTDKRYANRAHIHTKMED